MPSGGRSRPSEQPARALPPSRRSSLSVSRAGGMEEGFGVSLRVLGKREGFLSLNRVQNRSGLVLFGLLIGLQ